MTLAYRIAAIRDVDPHRVNRPPSRVVGFFGERGSGKSETMSWLALSFLARARGAGRDAKLFTNYTIAEVDIVREDIAPWLMRFPDEITEGVLCLDEVATVVPPERSTSSINIYIKRFFEQIRKRGLSVLYCTQSPMEVPHWLWWQTDLAIQCSSPDMGKSVEWALWDMKGKRYPLSVEEAKYLNAKMFPPPPFEPHRRLPTLRGLDKHIWRLYDTDEIKLPAHYLAEQRRLRQHQERQRQRQEEAEQQALQMLERARASPMAARAGHGQGNAVAQHARWRSIVTEGMQWPELVRVAAADGVSEEDLERMVYEEYGLYKVLDATSRAKSPSMKWVLRRA